MNEPFPVAVVDDDASMRESIQSLLRSAGMPARVFASAEEFLHSGAAASVSCLVLDVDMPGMTGPELFEELRKRGRTVPVIFMTGRADESLRARMLAAGAAGFFLKPFDGEDLLACAGAAAGHRNGD